MLENTDTPQEIEAITEEIDRFQRYIDEYLPGQGFEAYGYGD